MLPPALGSLFVQLACVVLARLLVVVVLVAALLVSLQGLAGVAVGGGPLLAAKLDTVEEVS